MKCERISLTIVPTAIAYLDLYILDNSIEIDPQRKRPAVVICPGGGYSMTSDREAEAVAVKMLSFGFQAFVLRYSVFPERYPSALLQLAEAVKKIRENHELWHVDEKKIIVAGFSAGGHLAASLGVFWTEKFLEQQLNGCCQDWEPNGLLLAYSVLSTGKYAHHDSIKTLLGDQYEALKEKMSLENQVTETTPKSFIWHTDEDDLVRAENSLLFASALRKNQIPFELHIFPKGGHGLSLATEETKIENGYGIQKEVSVWPQLFANWLKANI